MAGKIITQNMPYIFTSGNIRYLFTSDQYIAYFMQLIDLDGSV